MADAKLGLRERKKQRTRDAIVAQALALFEERGYEATTISDIAEAADIAPRTFFGYFASKEDVVFHDFEEMLVVFRQRLEQRAADETAFDALRAYVVEHLAQFESAEDVQRRRLVDETPVLRAHERVNMSRLEDVFADAVARDLDVAPGDLRARLVSAAAVAALAALGRHEQEADPIAGEALPILDEALVFLGGGLQALRGHASVAQRDGGKLQQRSRGSSERSGPPGQHR